MRAVRFRDSQGRAPRCLVLFAELGVGPGSRAFRDDQEYGLDKDKGLIMDSSTTAALRRLAFERNLQIRREVVRCDSPRES